MAAWWRCLIAVAALLPPPGSPAAPGDARQEWWQTAVVYHVDVRLFRDSDGDGHGDLAGVTENLDSLAKMGVDVVWLSPIFSSASEQFVGHSISNFIDIDPVFGDMAGFRKLVETASSLGMKVLLELVPNHTSDSHKWFEWSVKHQAPYTDYYIWKDGMNGRDDQEQPNNWMSVTGGSAWAWNEDRGQYFLHQFGDMQPDLNYSNENVRKQMEEVLLFWLRCGVSGFVLSSISHLYESKDLQDEPLHSPRHGQDWMYSDLVHSHTLDLPETYNLVQQWHKLMAGFGSSDNFTRFLVVESHSSLQSTMAYYGSKDNPVADIPLNFRFLSSLRVNNTAKEIEVALKDWLLKMPRGTTANWLVGSETLDDIVTHFSSHMVDALNIMLQVLPGVIIVYNGDVMSETTWNESVEYSSSAAGDDIDHPFNWDVPQLFGATSAEMSENKTSQMQADSRSTVEKSSIRGLEYVYAKLLKKVALRRTIPTLQLGDIHVSTVSTDILLLVRTLGGSDTFAAMINYGENTVALNISTLQHNATLVIVHDSSANSGLHEGGEIRSPKITLMPHASVLLRVSYQPLSSLRMYAEEPYTEAEEFLQEVDSNSTTSDYFTDMSSQLIENSTEIFFMDMPDNVTELFAEAETAEEETSTSWLNDNGTEISTRTLDNYTEIIVDNGTEVYPGAEEVENSTEISTAATVNNPELYTTETEYSTTNRIAGSSVGSETSDTSCITCNEAYQQTEPTTTKSTINMAVKRHTTYSLFILSLISLRIGLT